MKTLQPTLTGLYVYPKIEQHTDSNFFHELKGHSSGEHADHHYIEDECLHSSFEDEYDSYNSDFDLDTK